MKNDWIIDVLTDLRAFADKNGLSELARQLDEAALVAAAEIASTEILVSSTAHWDVAHVGSVRGTHGEGRDAG